jgi:hypothetical protein
MPLIAQRRSSTYPPACLHGRSLRIRKHAFSGHGAFDNVGSRQLVVRVCVTVCAYHVPIVADGISYLAQRPTICFSQSHFCIALMYSLCVSGTHLPVSSCPFSRSLERIYEPRYRHRICLSRSEAESKVWRSLVFAIHCCRCACRQAALDNGEREENAWQKWGKERGIRGNWIAA